MRLIRLLNKAARTLGYSQYPNKNVGFLGVVPSSQNLLRACSSSCSSMITESVPPSSQPYLSNTEIKEFGWKKFRDNVVFPKGPVRFSSGGHIITLKNMEDPKLIKIANIAVELFNMYQISGAYVEFLKVLEASKVRISCPVYTIILEGIDHGAGVKREYITKVWITNAGREWRLESFEPTLARTRSLSA